MENLKKLSLTQAKDEIARLEALLKKKEAALEKATRSKQEAEKANRAKDEFLANMSHDLRTPLTGIIGMADVLKNKLTDPSDQHNIHLLQESGQRLLSLCNGILEIISAEKINEEEIEQVAVDLGQEVLGVFRLEMPAFKLKGIDIAIDLDPTIPQFVITDRIKLQRILLNLVGNAIKFTEKGKISIALRKLNRRKEKLLLEFAITDTGIGIPKELQKKIFERFFRISPSHKGMYTGHGIGLHVIKKYVELLGGEVRLESGQKNGSTFFFTLLVEIDPTKNETLGDLDMPSLVAKLTGSSQKTSALTKEQQGINKNSLQLLIVEDDVTALLALKAMLEQTEYRVTGAQTSEEGFNLATSSNFDLIITDIGLSGNSGVEMAKQIREFQLRHNQQQVPIIALTGQASLAEEQACLQAGINKLITKPIRLEALHEILYSFNKIPQDESFQPKKPSKKDLPQTEADMLNLERFPLLDIELAKDQLGGDLELVKTILTSLAQVTPQDRERIVAAHEETNWYRVGRLAHKMKGGAIYCGTTRMVYASQYLERYHKAGEIKLLEDLYQQLIQVIDQTMAAVTSWLKKPAN